MTDKIKNINIDLNSLPEDQMPNRLEPGIHKVKFFGFDHPDEDEINYFIAIFKNKSGEHRERLYITDKARKWTNLKMLDWCKAAGISEDDMKSISNAEDVNDLLLNKAFKIKLVGEEYINSNGQVSLAAKMPLNKSVEPLDGQSLKFDSNIDIKKIPATKNDETQPDGNKDDLPEGTDDLPF